MTKTTELGLSLQQNKFVQLLEILILFLISFTVIKIAQPLVGENHFLRQTVVWVANIAMLFIIWLGLRFRGQGWDHLGLSLKFISLRTFLISLLVFFVALVGFVLGSIIAANIVGVPQAANMSGYNYLQGNLPMLIVALLAVFILSSFGEEVIYRGFLITRIAELGDNHKTWMKMAVLISAIIFGLIHFEWGVMGMIQTGFMGLALGISFLFVKRNLWALVFAHAYMDAILMIQMYFGGSMGN